jgi:tetratricopeptide (TPR) repeat protein
MKLILIAFIFLMALATSAQCQQTAEDWFNKGVVCDQLGEISNATFAYQQAVRIDPTFAEAWYNLGMDLYAVSDKFNTYDQATKCFTKAESLEPRLDDWLVGVPMQVNSKSDWDEWKRMHAA